jgi:competence protein ComEA
MFFYFPSFYSELADVNGAHTQSREGMKMKQLMKLGAIAGLLFTATAQAGPVNINTADEKTLEKELTGVGPAKAAAILEYREANGPFTSAADIKQVEGIGDAIYEQNKADIKVKD